MTVFVQNPPRKRISNEDFGMILFLVAEVMFFAGLASTYTVLRKGAAEWRPAGLPDMVSPVSISNTVLLFISAVSMRLATRAIRREDPVGLKFHLAFTTLIGLTFVGIQVFEFARLSSVLPIESLFGSVFYVYAGLHGAHVAGGVVFLIVVLVKAFLGRYNRYRSTAVTLAGWYWYFVVLVWVAIFLGLYVY